MYQKILLPPPVSLCGTSLLLRTVVACLLACGFAQADTNTFSGVSNSSLTTSANWTLSDGTTHSAPTASANLGSYKDLVLASANTALTTASGNVYASSWNISNGNAYVISANTASTAPTLRMGSTGATELGTFVNGVSTIPNDMVYLTGNSSLTINPNNSGGGPLLTVALRQSGNFNLAAGCILTLNAVVTGSGNGFTLTGPGKVNLGAANTFTGGTTINSGTLQYLVNNALATGTVTVAGGTLDMDGFTDTVGAVAMSAGSILGGGTLTAPSFAFTDSGNVTVSLAGTTATSGLTKTGEGLVVLSGTNTYTGITKISAGTLQVSGPLALSSGSTLNSGGSNGDSSALNLNTADAGYTMARLGVGGIMRITGPATGDATLTFLNGGSVTGTSEKRFNVGTGVTVFLNGATFDLIGTTGINHRVFAITVDGAMTINSVIQDNSSGTSAGFVGDLNKRGNGTLTLNGINTYGGYTTVTGGILAVNGTSLADTSRLILNGGQVQVTGTEIVDTLFFGVVQQAGGTWGATGSGATNIDDTRFAGTGVIQVTNGAPANFDTWMAGFTVEDSTASGDSDGDGLSNLIEYVVGGDPSVASQVGRPTAVLTNGNIVFTFKREDRSETTDVTLNVQVSTDLTDWTTLPSYSIGATTGTSSAGATVIENVTNPDTINVTIPVNVDVRKFVRLTATRTP